MQENVVSINEPFIDPFQDSEFKLEPPVLKIPKIPDYSIAEREFVSKFLHVLVQCLISLDLKKNIVDRALNEFCVKDILGKSVADAVHNAFRIYLNIDTREIQRKYFLEYAHKNLYYTENTTEDFFNEIKLSILEKKRLTILFEKDFYSRILDKLLSVPENRVDATLKLYKTKYSENKDYPVLAKNHMRSYFGIIEFDMMYKIEEKKFLTNFFCNARMI